MQREKACTHGWSREVAGGRGRSRALLQLPNQIAIGLDGQVAVRRHAAVLELDAAVLRQLAAARRREELGALELPRRVDRRALPLARQLGREREDEVLLRRSELSAERRHIGGGWRGRGSSRGGDTGRHHPRVP